MSTDWFKNSKIEYNEGKYVESYADMRQSYIIAKNVLEKLRIIQLDAVNSTHFITFFAYTTSVMLSHFFFQKETFKKLFSIIFYGIFTTLLFFVYPGYSLINPLVFLVQIFLIFFTTFIFIEFSKYFFRERGEKRQISIREVIGVSFSIAKRNLKRRRLDCIIMIISLTILVAAFIDLTSFSIELGLSIYTYPQVFPKEGIFVRPHFDGDSLRLTPVSREFISSLSRRYSEYISVIAPKFENQPVRVDKPLGLLIDPKSGNNITILGILGISPEEEAKVTRLNETVIAGNYLNSYVTEGILISVRAAMVLNSSGTLKLGDKLFLVVHSDVGETRFNYTLVGLFDDDYMSNLSDMNGDKILPKAVFPLTVGSWTLRSCSSDKTIILNYLAVSSWPFMVISRVNILCKNTEYILPLARQIVLTTPYSAWVTVSGKSFLLYIGRYTKFKGANLYVLSSLIVLNIISIALNNFERRRKEILTLSILGLNPTHIVMIFMAEAVICGLLGGGLGYILGISGYKILPLLPLPPSFEVKISFMWSVLSLFLAIAVSVGSSSLLTLKISKAATPSLTGRWRPDKRQHFKGEYWATDMPLRIMDYELENFITFLYNWLKEKELTIAEGVKNLELTKIESSEGSEYNIRFTFVSGETISQPIKTDNILEIRKDRKGNYYIIHLKCKPSAGITGTKSDFQFRETCLFIRRGLLLWEGRSYTIAAPLYQDIANLIDLIEHYQPRVINLLLQKEDKEKIDELINLLKCKGKVIPLFNLFPVDAHNFKECKKQARLAVENAKIVCITGGTEIMNKALLIEAVKRDKKVCYYIGVENENTPFIELEFKKA